MVIIIMVYRVHRIVPFLKFDYPIICYLMSWVHLRNGKNLSLDRMTCEIASRRQAERSDASDQTQMGYSLAGQANLVSCNLCM
mgnify:CR=1 FL=1